MGHEDRSPAPYRPPRKFHRVSKYLIPSGTSVFRLGGAPAPRRLAEAERLAAEFPDLVDIRALGTDDDRAAVPFTSVYRGEVSEHLAVAQLPLALTVARFRRSSCVGRHCAIVGPGNCLVADRGCGHEDGSLRKEIPFGRLNPKFWRYRWHGDLRNRGAIPAPQRVAGTALAINNAWCHNFYHWLLEVAPRLMLARDAGVDADWCLVDCQSRFQRRALELAGVPRSTLIQPHVALNLQADCLVRPSDPGASAWRDLARTIRQNLPRSAERSPQRIYISRRHAAHRRIADEAALESWLQREGFRTCHFEHLDFAEQVRLISQAEFIVAVHGAALANLIFAAPGTQVVEIFPRGRYNPDCFPRVSHAMGLQHVLVMADSTRFRQNLRVDVRDVAQAVDLCSWRRMQSRPRKLGA